MDLEPLDAEAVIRLLNLEWLPPEGGFFRSTYRSATTTEGLAGGNRPHSTAIYYLVTPEQFSALHRLPQDEVFHFYRGDAVEMLQIDYEGRASYRVLGPRFEKGEEPQAVAPGGVWQATRLVPGGKWALLGCTVSPGFDYADYEHGVRASLVETYPQHREAIERFRVE
jgi:uncharacterized protein